MSVLPEENLVLAFLYEINGTVWNFKHDGGGVAVYGCISASGLWNLVFIDEVLNYDVYLNLLNENLKLSARNWSI